MARREWEGDQEDGMNEGLLIYVYDRRRGEKKIKEDPRSKY